MKQFSLKRFGLKLVMLAMLGLPELADAQSFNPSYGDVLAGFRKTGNNEGLYELVVDLGNVTNFLSLSIGTTITITNFSPSQLTNAFIDTASETEGVFSYVQWSAFSAIGGEGRNPPPWVTPVGSIPAVTLWATVPATNVATQTQPPARDNDGAQSDQVTLMNGVGTGAASISGFLNVTNENNNTSLVRESVSYNQYDLTAYIRDFNNPTIGDFGADNSPIFVVENTTPNPFTSAQRDDFYQICPTGYPDPFTGLMNGAAYFVGYFILNPDGSMTFTRAAQAAASPVASFTGGPTTGFAGFSAVFTNTSTGSITNWIWNFGDGTIITNSTDANVTHTYASGGDYNVTLTVEGPRGSNAQIQTSLIMVSTLPIYINATRSGGQVVLSGTNCPVGVQYRILNSANLALPLTNWIPVVTNTFLPNESWTYTNATSPSPGFFRLVSP
jgi:PKD repeat protein